MLRATPPETGSETGRLLVVSALPSELAELVAAAEVEETRIVVGRTVHVGRLAGVEVVLQEAGVSMVNAAMRTQAALDRFAVEGIVVTGIAGAVDPSLRVGDVAVPARWGQYQESVFARETPDGFRPVTPRRRGEEYFSNYGMIFPRPQIVVPGGGEPDVPETRFWFPVDGRMLELARRAADHVEVAHRPGEEAEAPRPPLGSQEVDGQSGAGEEGRRPIVAEDEPGVAASGPGKAEPRRSAAPRLQRCTAAGDCLDHQPRVVVGGSGVSGPTFVDNAAYREWVWSTFHANAVDMETAAIGHVAYSNDLPFIGIRSLSDLAGADAGDNVSRVFYELAADNSAAVVIAFLEEWRGSR